MERRETPGMATDAPRRFAHFAGAPRVRQLVLARLILAGIAAVLTIAALVVLPGRATNWLERQPGYMLPARKIKLEPPPPAWYRGGAEMFLDRARNRDTSRETISVLGLDLKELQLDFQHYCWVEKVRVERSSPNRLVVHLEYREPMAIARCKVVPGREKVEPDRVIDKHGVILPMEDIDEETVRGLIMVVALDPAFNPRFGCVWKSGDSSNGQEQDDGRVVTAAKLADFLKTAQGRERTRPPALQLVAIHPTDAHTLFVQNGPSTMFLWGEAPGAEYPGQLTAEEKWSMLRDWVEAHPEHPDIWPSYLMFTRSGVVTYPSKGGL